MMLARWMYQSGFNSHKTKYITHVRNRKSYEYIAYTKL